MYALLSIWCGLASLLIPGYALLSRHNRPYASTVSLCLCAAAIYFQMLEYELFIQNHDWAGLLDISHMESIVSGALLISAVLLNALAWLLLERRKK